MTTKLRLQNLLSMKRKKKVVTMNKRNKRKRKYRQ